MAAQDQTGNYREAAKGTARLALWTLAWAATLALARFGPGLWDSPSAASWAAIAANLAVGVRLIVAHARYLRGLDELQRKINLDALAITFGVGYVAGFAYAAAHASDLIAHDAEIGLFAALLAVVYMVAILVGHVRYR